MIALKPGETTWVEPFGPGKSVWQKAKVVDTYGENSFIIEIDGRNRRSRVHLRKATGDLDKAECNIHRNEIMPFSYEEAGEATSEEKDRESNIVSSSSAEIHGQKWSYCGRRGKCDKRYKFLGHRYVVRSREKH